MRADQETDAALLSRVADGDQAALRELFNRHAAWLGLRLRRRTRDDDLVAETLQDTFVAVWNGARGYRGEGDIGAWVWGIAIRQLVTRLRKREAPRPLAEEVLSALSPTVRSAEDELLLAVEHGDVGTAMRQLSPQLRAVLQATVIDGLTTREAAHLLGIPQGTVKTRLRAARKAMREQLMRGAT